MSQLDWFILLIAAVVGGLYNQRIGWGIVAVLAVAKLLQIV